MAETNSQYDGVKYYVGLGHTLAWKFMTPCFNVESLILEEGLPRGSSDCAVYAQSHVTMRVAGFGQ